MDVNELVVAPLSKFAKESIHLVRICTKPDAKGTSSLPPHTHSLPVKLSHFFVHIPPSLWWEPSISHKPPPPIVCVLLVTHRTEFKTVLMATGLGFLIMGFIGFFVKLVHIPINQIILGMGS